MDNIYVVGGGSYSDWYLVGYFKSEEEAQKYTLADNLNESSIHDDGLWVKELTELSLTSQSKNLKVRYNYEIIVDILDDNLIIRTEPLVCSYFIKNEDSLHRISYSGKFKQKWFKFELEHNDKNVALKIVQDTVAELMEYSNNLKNIKLGLEALSMKWKIELL